jgi:hypothetical protein
MPKPETIATKTSESYQNEKGVIRRLRRTCRVIRLAEAMAQILFESVIRREPPKTSHQLLLTSHLRNGRGGVI